MAWSDTGYVLKKLAWMRNEGIWPNGPPFIRTCALSVEARTRVHHR